ncbi:mitochondrial carrier [Backusella circina FSU 941]|nr:mitochondrial carrier [Backusella circina FSU 941]
MSSHIACSKLNANETALCGGIAGMSTRLAISPLDVIKIRLQVQPQPIKNILLSQNNVKYSGIIQAFKTIVAEEGFRGLFKGNMAAEYLYLTYGTAQFYGYYSLNKYFTKVQQQQNIITFFICKFYLYLIFFFINMPSGVRSFLCGMLAGSVATTITYPFDLLRTRFAMQGTNKVYRGIPNALSDIYQREGVRGFYRGLGPSIVQIMPYMGLMFLSYECLCSVFDSLKKRKIIRDNHKRIDDMVCGSLAGIISKTGVFPLDVIRKRLQVQGPHRTSYILSSIPCYAGNSVLQCMQNIIRFEGFKALYKGLVPGLLKAGPAGAVNFLVFELSKDIITHMKETGFQLIPEKSPIIL